MPLWQVLKIIIYLLFAGAYKCKICIFSNSNLTAFIRILYLIQRYSKYTDIINLSLLKKKNWLFVCRLTMKLNLFAFVIAICCSLRRVQSSFITERISINHPHCFGSIDYEYDSCSVSGEYLPNSLIDWPKYQTEFNWNQTYP